MRLHLVPTRCVTAIKLSAASGVKRLQLFLQTTIEWLGFIPATAKAVALQLNLMAVTRCVGMQYQRAALRGRPQRGQHEFPRSAWELDNAS